MLTTTLRQLERDRLLSREVFPEVPPRVEYELTHLGLSLLEPMRILVHWIEINWHSIKKARVGFDSRALNRKRSFFDLTSVLRIRLWRELISCKSITGATATSED